jgi:hypothetical protein
VSFSILKERGGSERSNPTRNGPQITRASYAEETEKHVRFRVHRAVIVASAITSHTTVNFISQIFKSNPQSSEWNFKTNRHISHRFLITYNLLALIYCRKVVDNIYFQNICFLIMTPNTLKMNAANFLKRLVTTYIII